MSDAMPERAVGRGVSGLLIFLLTVAWVSGTVAFFVAAYAEAFGRDCRILPDDCLHADRLLLDSVACACVFPLLAALVCAATGRGFGAALFVVLGVSVTLVYGMTLGVGAARDMHRFEVPAPVLEPSNHCFCYSGGSCNCPGG